MSADYSAIQVGMQVYGVESKQLGEVQEIRSSGFVLHTGESEPHFIPMEVVEKVDDREHRVDLSIPEAELRNIDWKNPTP